MMPPFGSKAIQALFAKYCIAPITLVCLTLTPTVFGYTWLAGTPTLPAVAPSANTLAAAIHQQCGSLLPSPATLNSPDDDADKAARLNALLQFHASVRRSNVGQTVNPAAVQPLSTANEACNHT